MLANSRIRRIWAIVCAALLSTACTTARDRPLPIVAMPAHWTSPHSPVVQDAPANWWHSFNDPVLNRLIDEALRTNNDLAAAAIRVYRARLQAGLVDTNRTPNATLDAAGSVSHALDAHRTSRAGGITGTLSYELDLWGKLAAQRDAARWVVDATA